MRYVWTGKTILGMVLTEEEMTEALRRFRQENPRYIDQLPDSMEGIGSFSIELDGDTEPFREKISVMVLQENTAEGAVLDPSIHPGRRITFPRKGNIYVIPADHMPWTTFDRNGAAQPTYETYEELYSEMRFKTEQLCIRVPDLNRRIGILQWASLATQAENDAK